MGIIKKSGFDDVDSIILILGSSSSVQSSPEHKPQNESKTAVEDETYEIVDHYPNGYSLDRIGKR